jgi:Na+/H+ antiporter NhaD/arsenite permease-like protein
MITTLLLSIFFIGYFFITIEHYIKINKAAFALLIAAVSWVILIFNSTNYQEVNLDLSHHLVGVSEIVFFLLGAMTIVEIIDAHDGFSIISQKIKTNKKNQWKSK